MSIMWKMAIMLNSRTLKRWEAECIQELQASEHIQVEAILIGRGRNQRKTQAPLFYRWIEKWLGSRCQPLQSIELEHVVPGMALIEWDELVNEKLEEIHSFELDAIVDFSDGLWRSKLAPIPRQGLWSYVFGGANEGRSTNGVLYSIQGLMRSQSIGHVALVKAGEVTNPDISLKQGAFAFLSHSIVDNTVHLYHFCRSWPLYVYNDTQRCAKEGVQDGHRIEHEIRTESVPESYPSNARLLLFMLQLTWRKVKHKLSVYFMIEHWNVGIVNQPIEAFAAMEAQQINMLQDIEWIPRGNNFIADPFGIVYNGKAYICAEEYSHVERKGFISAIQVNAAGALESWDTIMEEPVHMSYPYLFEHEGKQYCVPETYQTHEATLYEALQFPHRWERKRTLIEGVDAVDSTLFQHEGRWWLFCTDEATGPNTHLSIWFADQLEGDWQPHPCNPVKMDIRCARPAGTPFYHQGQLYRPSQDCSYTYGGAVVLNRVDILTPTQFVEEPIRHLSADRRSPYPHGLHTISSLGERTLIDSKRVSLSIRVFVLRVRKVMLRRLKGKSKPTERYPRREKEGVRWTG